MPIDMTKITREMLEKAAQCETADELVALAKTEGIELTLEQAKAYLEELQDVELNQEALDKVAGGYCFSVFCGMEALKNGHHGTTVG